MQESRLGCLLIEAGKRQREGATKANLLGQAWIDIKHHMAWSHSTSTDAVHIVFYA